MEVREGKEMAGQDRTRKDWHGNERNDLRGNALTTQRV